MTFFQRLFSWIGPSVEAESREWIVECPKCGFEDNVWERGGVRYKAYGSKRVGGRCRSCGEFSMLKVYKR